MKNLFNEGDDRIIKLITESYGELTVQNAELKDENNKLKQELMAKSEMIKKQKNDLTRAGRENRETSQEVLELQEELAKTKNKSQSQASTIKDSMKKQQVLLEELDKLQKLQTKTQKQNAALALVLTDLTSMLTSLQDEAEQAASALEEAQAPAAIRYQEDHAQLLKQVRKMRNDYRSCLEQKEALKQQVEEATATKKNLWDKIKLLQAAAEHKTANQELVFSSLSGSTFIELDTTINGACIWQKIPDPDLFAVKNNQGLWIVQTKDGIVLAWDPEPKASPCDCKWNTI